MHKGLYLNNLIRNYQQALVICLEIFLHFAKFQITFIHSESGACDREVISMSYESPIFNNKEPYNITNAK